MRLHRLCDATETLTRFCTVIALGELRHRLGDAPFPDRLLKVFQPQIERPTFGVWRSYLHELIRALNTEESMTVPELSQFVTLHLLPALSAEPRFPETNLIELRNRAVHGGAMNRASAEELLNIWEPWLESRVLPELEFFSKCVVCYYSAGKVYQLMGMEAQGRDITLAPDLLALLATHELNGHVLLLRQRLWLDLWPLCDYGRATTTSLQGQRVASGEGPLVYIRAERDRLLYAALGVDISHGERLDVVHEFRALFRLDARLPGPSRQVVDFEQEIKSNAAQFIGEDRKALVKRVKKSIIDANTGVFWLTGPGGSGKSFMMAQLADDLRGDPRRICRIAWRFKGGDTVRCNRYAFFHHAVLQLAAWPPLGQQSVVPTQNPNELESQLHELLSEVERLKSADPRVHPPRVIFLLDGLDEIERIDPDFLLIPFRLCPAGVVWVCAGRTERSVEQAFTPDRCIHLFPNGLPAMTDNDIRIMLIEEVGALKYDLLALDSERDKPADVNELGIGNPAVEAVVKRASGLPLFVHFVVQDILAGYLRFSELADRLPPGLNTYYDDLLRRLPIGEVSGLLTPLLVTLCWAQAPLDEETLHLLMVQRKALPEGDASKATLQRGLVVLQSMLRVVPLSGSNFGYEPYHPTMREHIREDRSGIIGGQNQLAQLAFWELIEGWDQIPTGHPARRYCLQHGLGHLLAKEQFYASTSSLAAMDLCRKSHAAFLQEAVQQVGIHSVEMSLYQVFDAYLVRRNWLGATWTSIFLRWLHQSAHPIIAALQLLTNSISDNGADRYLADIERISDASLQRALTLFSAARSFTEGHMEATDMLLDYLIRQYPRTMRGGGTEADSHALAAILCFGPAALAEKLVSLPIYIDDDAQFEALVAAWARTPGGSLRPLLLQRLNDERPTVSPLPQLAVQNIPRDADANADSEMYLTAMRWLGRSSLEADIEDLRLYRLLDQPNEIIVQALSALRTNPALADYTVRAACCTLVLLGRTSCTTELLRQLLTDLASALSVAEEDILQSLLYGTEFAFETWTMTPGEFEQWLSVRLELITAGMAAQTQQTPDFRDALRRFTSHFCLVLRWIAAQSANSLSDQAAVLSCLSKLSGLVWHDPKAWKTPRLFGSVPETEEAYDKMDPLRAYSCLQSARWLTSQGLLAVPGMPDYDAFDRATAHEIVRLVFYDADERAQDEIETALAGCWGVMISREPGSLTGSPWCAFFKAAASSIPIRWQTNWEGDLPLNGSLSNQRIPDALVSYLEQLYERTVRIVAEIGWYPHLTQIGINISLLLNKPHPSRWDLLIPTLASMDPGLTNGLPNDETWPPDFWPLHFIRAIPPTLARPVAALELCDRGLLWKICWQLCRRNGDSRWWESVDAFRNSVKQIALTEPSPRIIWYRPEESPATFIESALAPINLVLDSTLRKKDFDILAGERNLDPDSNCVRLRQSLKANPKKEVLTWTIDLFMHFHSSFAFWLFDILVEGNHWDLLARLFTGLYADERRPEPNLLSALIEDEDASSYDGRSEPRWQERFEAVLGFCPGEGQIYRIEKLATQRLADGFSEDAEIQRDLAKLDFKAGWMDRLRALFSSQNVNQGEFVRSLLVIALFTGSTEPALLADDLVESASGDLRTVADTWMLWAGLAVAPDLITAERMLRAAQSKHGMEILARLGAWDMVRLHLESYADYVPSHRHATDGLLHWYHPCSSLPWPEQLSCLKIYNELAPQLLATREENREPFASNRQSPLMPVDFVSNKLKFAQYSLSKPIIEAAQHQQTEVAAAWMQAVLIEASYGPDRRRDEDCVQTLVRCAGAWLTIEQDAKLRDEWIKFLKRMSDTFGSRSVWNSFFSGVGECLGHSLGANISQWIIPDGYGAQLALGEELAAYGTFTDALLFWDELVAESESPWLAIRACAAFFNNGPKERPASLAAVRTYVEYAWRCIQESVEIQESALLAEITRYAVKTQSSDLLVRIAAAAGYRAPALSRIALDTFLEQTKEEQPWDEPRWPLADLPQIMGMQQIILILVDEPSTTRDKSDDMGAYNYSWSKETIRSGIGWIDGLLESIFQQESFLLLPWIGTWLATIRPERDKNWTVCMRIANQVARLDAVVDTFKPLLDFAITSVSLPHGRFYDQIGLVTALLTSRYRNEDLLRILDNAMDIPENEGYKNLALHEIAVACAQHSDSAIAYRYAARIDSLDGKYLTEDTIAEIDAASAAKRVEALSRAPQTTSILERQVTLCEEMLDHLPQLDDASLHTLASALGRVMFSKSDLEQRLAASIAKLLSYEDRSLLRAERGFVQSLSRLELMEQSLQVKSQ
jgi:hypothetical protein